jgi:hypothetical protein
MLLKNWDVASRRAIAAMIALLDVAAFSQSYRDLTLWALGHGVSWPWAGWWPLLIDAPVVAGEMWLFHATLHRAGRGQHAGAWALTLGGLAASLGGNIGHIAHAPWTSMLTFAAAPLVAAGGLFAGMSILRLRVAEHAAAEEAARAARASRPRPARVPAKAAAKPQPSWEQQHPARQPGSQPPDELASRRARQMPPEELDALVLADREAGENMARRKVADRHQVTPHAAQQSLRRLGIAN